QGGHLRTLHTPFTAFSPYIQAHSGRAFTIAGSPTEPIALIAVDLEGGRVEVLPPSPERVADPTYISVPQAIEFPTEGGVTAHAIFYPPVNPEYTAPASELSPLIVYV